MTHSSDTQHSAPEYEAPSLVVLGTVEELTALGAGAVSEALFDGSQA